MPIDALFLDFDGVICDTERAARQSWEELYASSGFEFPDRIWRCMMGNSRGEEIALADLTNRLARPVTVGERSWRLKRKIELADREPLCPGVAACLQAAATAGLVTAVVSSSSLSWVGAHLTRLGMHDRFSFLVTGEQATRHKPAPDLYRIALGKANIDPEFALAIEDSPTGVRAAHAAGLRCIAVSSSVGRHLDLGAANLVLETLDSADLDASFVRPWKGLPPSEPADTTRSTRLTHERAHPASPVDLAQR